jgi:hypothetical protein
VNTKPIALGSLNDALRFAEVANVYSDHCGTALSQPFANGLTNATPSACDHGYSSFQPHLFPPYLPYLSFTMVANEMTAAGSAASGLLA